MCWVFLHGIPESTGMCDTKLVKRLGHMGTAANGLLRDLRIPRILRKLDEGETKLTRDRWDWYTYLHWSHKKQLSVGKYISPMDYMGKIVSNSKISKYLRWDHFWEDLPFQPTVLGMSSCEVFVANMSQSASYHTNFLGPSLKSRWKTRPCFIYQGDKSLRLHQPEM